MRRRDFVKAFAGSAAVWSLAARAQEPGRIYRLGGLHLSPRNAPHHIALFEELQRAGFVEGKNVLADEHGYGLRVEQLATHAAELANARVDTIICAGDEAVRAAQQATKTIPILAIADDMVGSHLVESFSKPEGNTTGVSILSSDLDGKRQEILIEAVPRIRRMAALADGNTTSPRQLRELKDAAHARGVELSIHPVTMPDEVASAIDAAKKSDAAALNVLASPLLFANRQAIFERVTALRLPAIYQWPEMAEQDGLLGYGPRIVQLYRDIMARQLYRLLRGAKAGDLPVEQPTKFELVINLRAAKAIGHEIPAGLVLRSDKVIE